MCANHKDSLRGVAAVLSSKFRIKCASQNKPDKKNTYKTDKKYTMYILFIDNVFKSVYKQSLHGMLKGKYRHTFHNNKSINNTLIQRCIQLIRYPLERFKLKIQQEKGMLTKTVSNIAIEHEGTDCFRTLILY